MKEIKEIGSKPNEVKAVKSVEKSYKNIYKYSDSGSEFYYRKWCIYDRKTGELLHEVITNRRGEGEFIYNESEKNYKQIQGTLQFGMPANWRKYLRDEYEKIESENY
jgi:hypothetical protein